MQRISLTGDRPTGKLHLGHYIGSLVSRISLQETHKQYIMLADVQALTDHFNHPDVIRKHIFEVVLDYLSVGIDPTKNIIFIQSQIPELAELTIYYLNLVTLSRLERNPTVKTEIQQKCYSESIPAGFLCYPISQAADITAFQANIVPIGIDQMPMIEQTNEIVRKFNRSYNTTCLREVESYLSPYAKLIGIDGKAKASKSLGNAIYLSDTEEEVKRKVFSMFTDPNHIRVSDPGNIAGNVVFRYLDAFHDDQEEVSFLKQHYARGGLGDVTIKNILNSTIQNFLAPIRAKRHSFKEKDIAAILAQGAITAREAATDTLEKVKEAMGIKYIL